MSYMEQEIIELERALEESRDEETGELKADDILAFEDLIKTEIAPKMDRIMWVIKRKEALSEMLKQQKAVLTARIAQIEKDVERLENRILFGLSQISDNNKYETDSFKYSTRKSSQVVIAENAVVPKEYLREKVTVEPDKKLLKEHLSKGLVLEGINLVEKTNLSVK